MHCSKELRELLIALVDPSGGEQDWAQLAEILRSDPEALAYYVEFMDVHANLKQTLTVGLSMPEELFEEGGWQLTSGAAKVPPTNPSLQRLKPISTSKLWSRLRYSGGLAAAVCLGALAAGLAGLIFMQGQGEPSAVSNGEAVLSAQDAARVVRLTECRWDEGPLTVNDYVLPGGSVNLVSGVAELQLADGATVLVEGPASFVVEASDTAYLKQGRITCSVLSSLDGFTVRTPLASVINLGAAFSVSVGPDGSTETHVGEGVVGFQSIADEEGSEAFFLSKEEGARISANLGAEPELIEFQAGNLKTYAEIETIVQAHLSSGVVRSHGQGMSFGGYMGPSGTGTRRIGTSTLSVPERFGQDRPIGLANVFLFVLPPIANTNSITDVQFEFTYSDLLGNPSYGADLYGLGYFNLQSPRQDWYFDGKHDQTLASDYGLQGLAAVSLIVEDLLTPDSRPGKVTVGGEHLLAFLRDLYRNGAKTGDVAVLRLSPNGDLSGEPHATGYRVVHPPAVLGRTTVHELPILRITTSVQGLRLASTLTKARFDILRPTLVMEHRHAR